MPGLGRGLPRALIAVVAIGLALRLATLAVPAVHHPDEIYQYLEAAHRQAFGYGVVPWEYRVGMRSWLLPILLAGPMALGDAMAPNGGLYLLLPRLLMVLASTTIIVSAWTLGARSSRRHALVAAIVAATWYELIAFAGHPIGESAGLVAACGAAALMFGPNSSRNRLVVAGGLLALAAILRFQYGPALLVLAAFGGGRDFQGRWLPLASGGMMLLVISSLIDLGHGALPFAWLIENIRQNLILNKAAHFGVSGPLTYIGVVGTMWRWASVPIIIAAYAGMRRQPALFWAAIVHFAVHSLIGHKEYRFILLTDGFAVILAAIGSVDLVDAVATRWPSRRGALVPTAMIGLWLGISLILAMLPWNRPLWTARASANELLAELRDQPGLCGIAVLGLPISELGGYVGLHRDVPIYIPDARYPNQRQTARALAPAYNALIATSSGANAVPPGFQSMGCRSTAGEYIGAYANPEDVAGLKTVCRYVRPSSCSASLQARSTTLTINPVLAERGM